MNRLALAAATAAAVLALVPASPAALAAPMPVTPLAIPKTGDHLDLAITGSPRLDWMYDAPSPKDSAGKVVIHWFCAPRLTACTDDLARLIALRDTGKVYIIAYINGTKADAKKLDPIRESEGIGKGTVAYGPKVGAMMKQLGFAGPASIVVGADMNVALVTTNGATDALDGRDQQVNALAGKIRDFQVEKNGPKDGKAGQPFTLELVVHLASWLKYSAQPEPATMTITVPKDIKCDATTVTGDKLVVSGNTMTATVHCTAPRGSYEARAEIRFGYDSLAGANGIGTDAGDWKFTVTP